MITETQKKIQVVADFFISELHLHPHQWHSPYDTARLLEHSNQNMEVPDHVVEHIISEFLELKWMKPAELLVPHRHTFMITAIGSKAYEEFNGYSNYINYQLMEEAKRKRKQQGASLLERGRKALEALGYAAALFFGVMALIRTRDLDDANDKNVQLSKEVTLLKNQIQGVTEQLESTKDASNPILPQKDESSNTISQKEHSKKGK